MLAPVIVIVSPYEAYMQKQKPQPIGQPDIEILAMRLGVEPSMLDTDLLDDVMSDGGNTHHPARRLRGVVRGKGLLGATEYHTAPDDSVAGMIEPAKPKAKRGRPPKKKK